MTAPNISRGTWAADELATLGIAPTSANLNDLVAWSIAEGGWYNNPDTFNPLNTTEGAPGAISTNSAGVKAYPDLQTGLIATAEALTATRINGADPYTSIIQDLQNGASIHQFAADVGATPWGTSEAGILGAAEGGNNVTMSSSASGAGSIDLNPIDLYKTIWSGVSSAGSAVSGSIASGLDSIGQSLAKNLIVGLMAIVFIVASIGLIILGLLKMFNS
ncbi:MAG: hypothetical protein KGJ01_02460 [Patescibacteria group bacterium]|nr:hypothetical protein [Patescibacteria group bacterium]